jgi:HSP20 family molecular chaperone IbpA
MAFFPRNIYDDTTSSFGSLFRLLDDFDSYQRQGTNLKGLTFNPKFDVRETDNTYELHGELPGIKRENISIEFTGPQTVVIRGRVQRSYQSGTPPAGYVEGARTSGAITEGGEEQPRKPHSVTVEDEEANEGTVAQKNKQEQEQPQQPKEKYWVSERSVGEFSRTFSFPTRVDQDGVSASLNDGILNVTVPKAKKTEGRRITIN